MFVTFDNRGPRRQILAGLIELPGVPAMTGISLDDAALRFATVRQKNRQLDVVSYGAIALNDTAVHAGEVRDPRAFVDALRHVERVRGSAVHFALPAELSHIFDAQVSRDISEPALPHLIAFQAADAAHTTPEQLYTGYREIASEGSRAFGVGAFHRDIAHAYRDLFREAGMPLSSIEASPAAAARMLVGDSSSENTLMIEVSDSRAHIFALRGSVLVSASNILLSGTRESIARALAHAVTEYQHMQLLRAVRGLRGTPVVKVILFGSAANPGMATVIARESRIPAAMGDVWSATTSASGRIPAIPKEESHAYAPALGVAIRAFAA